MIIYMFFHGLSFSGLSGVGNPSSDLTPVEQQCQDAENIKVQADPDKESKRASVIITGDGRGQLAVSPGDSTGNGANEPCTVPEKLFKSINDAGGICDAIGPVTVASQIEYESGFDADFVGLDQARGISQVPQEVFARLEGAKADPFDAKKSINAQGKYLCELSGQIQDLLDQGKLSGNKLDLTLVAYHSGLGVVTQEKGVPSTSDAQKYVTGVRTWFASMEGIGPIPRKLTGVAALHDGDGKQFGDPTAPQPTPTNRQPPPEADQ
ncbi:lytic transglycosylase domain-containing protein [Streptomyces sp. B3I7]|uniref:lytic transglycosylase domain-containing protein n=1 Tax=Streptomyces sp. B3I7 TaxID=3042269 RepID=UPI0027D7A2D4|nr:lytic transglycosylase domain-containing protein [Streptomyces sp. B3I7]